MPVTCVVCKKSTQDSDRRLLHPPPFEESRAIRDFYVLHVNPSFLPSAHEKRFTCRQLCYSKLEQALRHLQKANVLITELKFGSSGDVSPMSTTSLVAAGTHTTSLVDASTQTDVQTEIGDLAASEQSVVAGHGGSK